MQKRPKVSVAIPAFNEEKNIKNILLDVLTQKQKSFDLKTVIVYSDASSDRTDEIVKKFAKKHFEIKLRRDNKRKGKFDRVNQAFRECKSDILIVLDADIALVGKLFLENMVKLLVEDKKVVMVASHHEYMRPSGFMANVIYANVMISDLARMSMPDQLGAMNVFGMAIAYKGSFARSLRIPKYSRDPKFYIYMKARLRDGFRYCYKAVILQWLMGTLSDFNKLLRRSTGQSDARVEKLFEVNKEDMYHIPMKYKVIGIIKTFARYPFYTPFGLLLILYTKFYLKYCRHFEQTPIWEIHQSTKKAFERS